jgi:CHAT domain-containing protein/Tfp pilus assembly protein PilF
VDVVLKDTPAQKAGVKRGDILLTWARNETRGTFESPFNLSYVFLDQGLCGPITINAVRGNQPQRWLFGPDSWNISVRPNFTEPLLSIYSEGEQLFASEKWAEGVNRFREAAAIAGRSNNPWLAPWFLSHAAKSLSRVRQWALADTLYAEAVEQANNASPLVRSELFRQRAVSFESRDNFERAARYYTDALVEYKKLGQETMPEANILLSLAVVELKQGQFDEAEEHLELTLRIAKELAPASMQTLLAIGNLAVLYQDEGQLEKAEEYYFKALDDEEKNFPKSIQLAQTLRDLGVLFDQQGDLRRAEAYERRALFIAQQLNPSSLDVSNILASLAECLLERGYPSQAYRYQQHALAITERIAPGGMLSAYSLAGLGKVARVRGFLSAAEDYYRKSLAIATKVNAPGADRARFLLGLAAVLRQRGDFADAENLYRQALRIIAKDDPASIDRGSVLGDLASVVYRQNRSNEAAEFYRQALNTLDNRFFHLGGVEETRSRYRAEHIRYYQEYVKLLIEQRKPEMAFEVMEGARARTLLAMLGKAHVGISKSADPGLSAKERKLRRSLNAETAYRLRVAEQPHADQQLAVIDKQIEDLLLQLQQVQIQLRVSDPSYAALADSQKMGVNDIQRLLDPNTLLLEYSLAEDGSYVWAVSNDSLQVFALPRRPEIEAAARRVYNDLTLRNKSSPDDEAAKKQYERDAKRLSKMVVGPIAHLVTGKRLVVVADGALQFVPFSALPRPGLRAHAVPLLVTNEIVNLPSASVLAELRRHEIARVKASKTVAIFADPVFDATDERLGGGGSEPATPASAFVKADLGRSTYDLGLTRGGKPYLSRLLYTRNEADAVMAVVPPRKAMLALDFEANRRAAMNAALARYRIIHFATHGILNNRHPELSGLVLSLVDKNGKPQDGFLNLQDIYNLKLPVELVVLSGCQTGLGEQNQWRGFDRPDSRFHVCGRQSSRGELMECERLRYCSAHGTILSGHGTRRYASGSRSACSTDPDVEGETMELALLLGGISDRGGLALTVTWRKKENLLRAPNHHSW